MYFIYSLCKCIHTSYIILYTTPDVTIRCNVTRCIVTRCIVTRCLCASCSYPAWRRMGFERIYIETPIFRFRGLESIILGWGLTGGLYPPFCGRFCDVPEAPWPVCWWSIPLQRYCLTCCRASYFLKADVSSVGSDGTIRTWLLLHGHKLNTTSHWYQLSPSHWHLKTKNNTLFHTALRDNQLDVPCCGGCLRCDVGHCDPGPLVLRCCEISGLETYVYLLIIEYYRANRCRQNLSLCALWLPQFLSHIEARTQPGDVDQDLQMLGEEMTLKPLGYVTT